ncbi:FMN-dependent dehydrogenase [Kockiozyma suomiensis]|uniref:FMN-dependent dehydrogenase n=1 Tax=Kockiozyma suomiensis TaxID=1337062 RepID=UPI00334391BE
MLVLNVDDIEQAVRSKLDKMTWDFWAGGANDLITIAENKAAYEEYRIRPRYMRNVTQISTRPRNQLFSGIDFTIPCGLAPSSMHRLAHSDAEHATAKAAKSRSWPMAISSYSTLSLEDAKAAAGDSLVFFQLYVFKNRETSADLVRRAEAAGFKAVLITIDSPFLGLRFAESRNKFTLPPGTEPGNFAGARYAGPIDFAVESKSKSKGPGKNDALGDAKPNIVDPALTFNDIKWLKSITKMQVWVKGVMTAEDAVAAVDAGVDGIWVSNHGGRQLDQCMATLHALPEVVEAVKGRIPVHVDGGVRRGSDIFKALALGADFVWIGRPVLWGLKYGGQAGVELVEQFLEDELRLCMALSGTTSVKEINKSYLTRRGPTWARL